jgi:hypothetical protein
MNTLTFEKIFEKPAVGDYIGAKIIIDGESLQDKIKAIETPFAIEVGLPESARDYNHQYVDWLYRQLKGEARSDTYPDRIAFMTCACTVDECGGFWGKVNDTDNEIVWYGFRTGKRMEYTEMGEFRFDIEQYNKSLEELKLLYEINTQESENV